MQKKCVGYLKARCKHCGKYVNLLGTPDQVLLHIKQHFDKEQHSKKSREEVAKILETWETLSEKEREEAIEKLLKQHFEKIA